MKLAVKFYKDAPNPHGIPEHWPAEVQEVCDGVDLPDPWVQMSTDEYEAYRSSCWVETKRGPNLVDAPSQGVSPAQASSGFLANFALLASGAALGVLLAKLVLHYLGGSHG
jgi:hypothetical protein